MIKLTNILQEIQIKTHSTTPEEVNDLWDKLWKINRDQDIQTYVEELKEKYPLNIGDDDLWLKQLSMGDLLKLKSKIELKLNDL